MATAGKAHNSNDADTILTSQRDHREEYAASIPNDGKAHMYFNKQLVHEMNSTGPP